MPVRAIMPTSKRDSLCLFLGHYEDESGMQQEAAGDDKLRFSTSVGPKIWVGLSGVQVAE